MASIDFKHSPFGDLAIVSMRGCEDISSQVDYYLKNWRDISEDESFVIPANCPRFGTGEAKAVLNHTARVGHTLDTCVEEHKQLTSQLRGACHIHQQLAFRVLISHGSHSAALLVKVN